MLGSKQALKARQRFQGRFMSHSNHP